MKKNRWRTNEVISYLESKFLDGSANAKEMELYEDYVWNNGKITKNNYIKVINRLLREMNKIYAGK